jgi:hypothetical protein
MTIALRDDAPEPTLRDRMFGPTAREKYLDTQVAAVEQVLSRVMNKHENAEIDAAMGEGGVSRVRETLADVEMMLDARGWNNVFEYAEDGGLSLRQVKEASKQIRELLVGNPFVINGARVRASHVWGGGVEFSKENRTGRRARGALPADLQRLMESPAAQRYVFGNDARKELEDAAFSDGNVFILGQDSTKRMQRIPVSQITGDLRNPDNTEEIWAYRREWYQDPNNEDVNKRKQMVRWYYADIYDGTRKQTITFKGKSEKIETGYTVIDKVFNRQVGWAYGVPDALAIIAWVKLYREFLVNGFIMSKALARFAFKVTVSSARGADNASTEVTMPGQAGATAIEGQGQSLQAISSAGSGYDFKSGGSLAAAIAAGLGVSLLALLSDPASASGSNAAAQSLDGPARAMAVMRRRSWDDFFLRLFRWMGLQQKLVVTWSDLTDDTIQRIMQAWTLIDQMELFEAEILQREIAKLMNIADPGDIPEGWKPKSKRGIKPSDSVAGNGGATGGTDQGRGDDTNPDGGGQDDHDDDD